MNFLSEKTLEKKYEFYQISYEENKELHKYLNCFSNLYGTLQIKIIWEVLKKYDIKISKKKFYNFIDIVQREKNDYSIFNLCDVYTGEKSSETKDKLLINNELAGYGSKKLRLYYVLEDNIDRQLPLCVLPKSEFLKYYIDNFWFNNDYAVAMVDFVCNLETTGFFYNYIGLPNGEILDIFGEPTYGKKLKDICFYDHMEQYDFDNDKRPFYRERFIQEHNIAASKKVLNNIKDHLTVGRRVDFSQNFKFVLDYITDDCGVVFTKEQSEEFAYLYNNLYNHSHLWRNYGWSLFDLSRVNINNNVKVDDSYN